MCWNLVKSFLRKNLIVNLTKIFLRFFEANFAIFWKKTVKSCQYKARFWKQSTAHLRQSPSWPVNLLQNFIKKKKPWIECSSSVVEVKICKFFAPKKKKKKGCATLWPCHFYIVKISEGKRRIIWKLKYLTMPKYSPQKIL